MRKQQQPRGRLVVAGLGYSGSAVARAGRGGRLGGAGHGPRPGAGGGTARRRGGGLRRGRRGDRRGHASAGHRGAGGGGRPGARRPCRGDPRRAGAALDRLSLDHRRLWRPRRRRGGRGDAARPRPAAQPAAAGGRAGTGRRWPRAARWTSSASAASTAPAAAPSTTCARAPPGARCKPGHLFGRIHRDDIALAVWRRPAPGAGRPGCGCCTWWMTSRPRARWWSRKRPGCSASRRRRPIPFEQALPGMSAMARSFWSENRRVANAATKAALGIAWRYPSYREGLAAILAEERGEGPA